MVTERNINALQFLNIVGRVKPFNGKSNFKSFISQFNMKPKLENWNENNKVSILRCLCIETAHTYVNLHPETDDLNFDELVLFLGKRFKNVISTQEAYNQFTNIKQGYLCVRDYASKINEIRENVMDILTEFDSIESRDQFLIFIFINGLNLEI